MTQRLGLLEASTSSGLILAVENVSSHVNPMLVNELLVTGIDEVDEGCGLRRSWASNCRHAIDRFSPRTLPPFTASSFHSLHRMLQVALFCVVIRVVVFVEVVGWSIDSSGLLGWLWRSRLLDELVVQVDS